MQTFYIPVRYYEREPEESDIMILITQHDFKESEIEESLKIISKRYSNKHENYDSVEDMADAVFNALAKETGGIWSYCNRIAPLTLGDFSDCEKPEKLRAINLLLLSTMLYELKLGENLEFYEENIQDSDDTVNCYTAVKIKEYNRNAIYLDYFGNGLPYNITIYSDSVKEIESEIRKYFRNRLKRKHVFIDANRLKGDSDYE